MLFNIEDKVYNRSLKNKIKVSLSIIYNKFLKLNDLNKTFEALNLAALNIFKKTKQLVIRAPTVFCEW